MKLSGDILLRSGLAVLIVAAGVWVALNTEWVDVDVPNQLTDAERRDPDLRLKQILRRLGAQVVTPQNLDRMPPPGATLVLGTWQWNLFPERAGAMQRWVESGGDLVLPNWGSRRDGLEWVPLTRVVRRGPAASAPSATAAPHDSADSGADDDDDDHDDSPAREHMRPPAPSTLAPPLPHSRCSALVEPAAVVPAFDAQRRYQTCMDPNAPLRAGAPLQWALAGASGIVIARVPLGRGSVTASGAAMPWDNTAILDRDNALIAAAMLRAHRGREIWIVTTEARAPLLSFLWERGAPAVLLGACALALALWRGAVRFGPPAAAAPLARRSVTEQIRGTAAFIAHHGGAALHTAQLRALADAARPRIRGYDAMIVSERAQAVALLAGLDAHALARVMGSTLNAPLSRHPAGALALLETARRRLLDATRPPSTSPESR